MFRDVRDLEEKYYKEYRDAPKDKQRDWLSLFFNTLEFLSLLVNRRLVTKLTLAFFQDAIRDWYEGIFDKHASEEQKSDPSCFPEIKKLYRRIKDKC